VLDRLSAWLDQHNLPATVLKDKSGTTVGLSCEVTGSRPAPRWVFDACPDTAPFVIGGRGVHRTRLHVHGVASHSGGSKTTPQRHREGRPPHPRAVHRRAP
jgi:hypothetical protein